MYAFVLLLCFQKLALYRELGLGPFCVFLGRMRRPLEFYLCSMVHGMCRMNLLCSVDAGGLVGKTAPSVFTIPLRCHALLPPFSSVHVGTCV